MTRIYKFSERTEAHFPKLSVSEGKLFLIKKEIPLRIFEAIGKDRDWIEVQPCFRVNGNFSPNVR